MSANLTFGQVQKLLNSGQLTDDELKKLAKFVGAEIKSEWKRETVTSAIETALDSVELSFSREDLKPEPPVRLPWWVAPAALVLLIVFALGALFVFSQPQQQATDIPIAKPATQLVPTPQPPASPIPPTREPTVPPTRAVTQAAGELKPGNTVKVKAPAGVSYLTRPVPFGDNWKKYETGQAAPEGEIGIVTEVDQSGKFVKFVSSLRADTEGWVDVSLLERLSDPVATGNKNVYQKFDEPVGTGPLQLSTLNGFGNKTFSVSLQGASSVDGAKVWINRVLVRYVVLDEKRTLEEVAFQYFFKCSSATEIHSVSVTTLRNGFVAGSTTRPIMPCATPYSP